MSEEYKKTEVVESINFNGNGNNYNKKERLLRRKKKRINRLALNDLNKVFDLGRIKTKLSKILEEEYNSKLDNKINIPKNSFIKKISNIKDTGIFLTTNIVTFIKKISQDLDQIPEDYKSLELSKLLFKITKTFLFNDFELLNFSIYLDKMGWDRKSLDPEDFLFVLGLAVKVKLAEPSNQTFFIENLQMENPELYFKYIQWITENKLFSQLRISEKDLNSKYKTLSRPPDFFCKSNLIDYNYIVEKILKMSVTYSDNKANKELKNTEITSKLENSSNAINNGNDFKFQNPNNNLNFPNFHQQQSLHNYTININNKEAFKLKENYSLNNSNTFQNKTSSFNNNEVSNSNNKNNEFKNHSLNNLNNNLRAKNEKYPLGKSEEIMINTKEDNNNNKTNHNVNTDNQKYEESNNKTTNPFYPNGYYPGLPINYMYPPFPHPFPNATGAPNENISYPFYPPPQIPLGALNGNPHIYLKQYEEYIKSLSNSNNNNNMINHKRENPLDIPNPNFPFYPNLPIINFPYDQFYKQNFQNYNNPGNNNQKAPDNPNSQDFNMCNKKNNLISFEKNDNKNNINNDKANNFTDEGLLNKINNYKILNSNESCVEMNPDNTDYPRLIGSNKNSNLNNSNMRFIEMQNNVYSFSNQKGSSKNLLNDFYINLEMRGDNSNSYNIISEDTKSYKNFSMANQTQSFPNEEYINNKYLDNLKQMIGNNSNLNN